MQRARGPGGGHDQTGGTSHNGGTGAVLLSTFWMPGAWAGRCWGRALTAQTDGRHQNRRRPVRSWRESRASQMLGKGAAASSWGTEGAWSACEARRRPSSITHGLLGGELGSWRRVTMQGKKPGLPPPGDLPSRSLGVMTPPQRDGVSRAGHLCCIHCGFWALVCGRRAFEVPSSVSQGAPSICSSAAEQKLTECCTVVIINHH